MAPARSKTASSLPWKRRAHRNLVLLQLALVIVAVYLMGAAGFGIWTISALCVCVILMIASMLLQRYWRKQVAREWFGTTHNDKTERVNLRRKQSLSARAASVASPSRNQADETRRH